MITTSWKTFITTHPDRDTLSQNATVVANLIDPAKNPLENAVALQNTKSTLVLSLDPFTHKPTPHFYHQLVGLPLPGQTMRILALQGFSSNATAIELDTTTLFSQTPTTIQTPSLTEFLSFSDKTPTELETITTDATEKHHIRLAATLPPDLSVLLIASNTNSAWTMLYQAIILCEKLRPENNTNNNDFAADFAPLLRTLWAFTRSTDETKNINHIARSIATDETSQNWYEEIHKTHMKTNNDTPPSNPTNIVEGINKLTESITNQNNNRFAQADEEKEEGEDKTWKKLDPTFKKIIQFASTTDGENPQTEPTTRLLALLKSKSGTVATRLFTQWHTADMIVQTGMATNITKGCLVSFDGPCAVNTFSPFFTPPQRAGFKIISHDEINNIELLSESKNLTQNDIKKLTQSQPYIPTEPHIFIAQIKNFKAVVSDILGEDALTTRGIGDIISHYEKNELLYYNIFAGDKDFPVWFLNQLHFKTQQIFHHCASATSVMDVPFHNFNMESELTGITTLTYTAKKPLWHTITENNKQQERDTRDKKRQFYPHAGGNYNNDRNTSRTVTNDKTDIQTKANRDERYAFIVHRKNLTKCSHAEVTDNGTQICNNWHIRGWCVDGYRRSSTHKTLKGEQLEKYRAYVSLLRTEMKKFESRLNNGNDRYKGGPDQYNNYNKNKIPFGPKEQKSSTGEKNK